MVTLFVPKGWLCFSHVNVPVSHVGAEQLEGGGGGGVGFPEGQVLSSPSLSQALHLGQSPG